MNVRSPLSAAAVAVVLICMGTPAPAIAAPDGMPSAGWAALPGGAKATPSTYTDARGAVHYRFNPVNLPGHVVVRETGTRTSAGCEFSAQGSGSPVNGPRFTKIVEVGFDVRDCTRTLAVASYPGDDVPATVRNSDDTNASPAVYKWVVEEPVLLAAAGASYSGYLKANVEDPVQINVTSTKSKVSWTATSSCVTSSTQSPSWYWFTTSGWSRTSSATLSSNRTCDRARINIAGKFKNDDFCPGSGNTTYADHSKTLFEGRPGGRYAWAYTMVKSGGCSALLHYDYDLLHP